MKSCIHYVILGVLFVGRLWASDEADLLAREAEMTVACQERWSAVVARADRIVATPMILRNGMHPFELSNSDEVRSLLSGLRFVRPDIDWTSQPGFGVVHSCRCLGELRVTIYHREELIAEFLTRHGKFIEDAEITAKSRMEVDKAWMAQFYQRVGLTSEKKGEPGATDNPGDAQ